MNADYILMSTSDDSGLGSHYGLYGLENCQGGRCTSQILEIVVSLGVMGWVLFEFVMQCRIRIRVNFSWQEVMLLLIFLCLAFNICFMVWPNIILWYVLECLMNQIYFTTLVYYFTKKYFEKITTEEERPCFIVPLLITYSVFCLGELGNFIFIVNQDLHHCKEMSELIVNATMIILCLFFFILAYKNQREERLKFQEYQVTRKMKNPLDNIWIWAFANILGQIVSEIENALIYNEYGGQECYPVQDSLETEILAPVFMVLTKAVPFCSTLWFYSQRRSQTEDNSNSLLTHLELAASQPDTEHQVVLISHSANGSGSSSLNTPLI